MHVTALRDDLWRSRTRRNHPGTDGSAPELNTEPSVLLLLIFRLRVVRFVFFRTYILLANGRMAPAQELGPSVFVSGRSVTRLSRSRRAG